MDNKAQVENFSSAVAKIKQEIKKDLVGQEDIVDNVLIAIIAGGNVLLEGVPGVGKTRMVRSLGKVLALPFSRIQFTPDLMPSDVTGTNVIEKDANGKMPARIAFPAPKTLWLESNRFIDVTTQRYIAARLRD